LGLASLCVAAVVIVALAASWQLVVVALAVALAGYSALRTGQWAVALGVAASALALVTWTVVRALGQWGGIPTGVGPLVVMGPTLLVALASAWWRSSPLVKAVLPAGLAGLVLGLLAFGRLDAVVGLSYVVVGVFGVCGIARAVAHYYAAPFLAVALGCLCGGVVSLLPAFLTLGIFMTQWRPTEVGFQMVIVCFATAGGLLGAVAGAARRRGARTDFGVYPNPGIGPAVEVPAFQGPPLRLSASQLRAMADLLDRHGQTFQLRPLLGRPAVKARPPAPDARRTTPEEGPP
jgi:hypothetical protein